jgi:hypothetical protein
MIDLMGLIYHLARYALSQLQGRRRRSPQCFWQYRSFVALARRACDVVVAVFGVVRVYAHAPTVGANAFALRTPDTVLRLLRSHTGHGNALLRSHTGRGHVTIVALSVRI